jgi:thymidine kinase
MLNGYLELFIGPVNSSKSFYLMNKFNEYLSLHISVVLINYGEITEFTSDNSLNTNKLMDLVEMEGKQQLFIKEKSKVRRSNVILIDNGHKYEDLVDFVNFLLTDKKHICICGLDSDFERKKIGHIVDLIPVCDKINKLNSFCNICKNGTPGIFTKLTQSSKFISVCRTCFNS